MTVCVRVCAPQELASYLSVLGRSVHWATSCASVRTHQGCSSHPHSHDELQREIYGYPVLRRIAASMSAVVRFWWIIGWLLTFFQRSLRLMLPDIRP